MTLRHFICDFIYTYLFLVRDEGYVADEDLAIGLVLYYGDGAGF